MKKLKRMLLNKNKSVNSKNKEGLAEIELHQTAKPIIYGNVRETIDSIEVFNKERYNSNLFRLIVSIKPYCTNVLFNTITEIVKDEGSLDPYVVTDISPISYIPKNKVYGKNELIDRSFMIQNTEYSRPSLGYNYHPGYDFFNNHLLRNKTFKKVCDINTTPVVGMENTDIDSRESDIDEKYLRDIFNTMVDFFRRQNGDFVSFKKRNNLYDDLNKLYYKHIYDVDDILSFDNGDAINENLIEDNGWFGFINKSIMPCKRLESDFKSFDMNIDRPLNNFDNGEIVDMYPNRKLYSFTPIYNDFKGRLEYNWDICITYPFKCFYDHDLVLGNGVNGLKVMSIYKGKAQNGSEVLYFRTFSHHGLKRNDHFNLYSSDKCISKNVFVMNLGDENRKHEKYVFYTSDLSILDELLEDSSIISDFEDDNAINSSENIRIRRVVNDVESKYYFRLFAKLPNFKFSKESIEDFKDLNEDDYELFVKKNACDKNGKMYDFTNEKYNLGFSSTIYNDACSQITYTDNIDLSNLRDNLGRPITEIYTTIIKTNRGHKKWYEFDEIGYKTPVYGDDGIEFSHCFGKVSSGIEISDEREEKYDFDMMKRKARLSDVSYLNNIESTLSHTNMFDSIPLEEDINIDCEPFKNFKDGYLDVVNEKEIVYYDNDWKYSDFINIKDEEKIIFDNGFGVDASKKVLIYDEDMNFVTYKSFTTNPLEINVSLSTYCYVRLNFYKDKDNKHLYLRNGFNELIWEDKQEFKNYYRNYENGYISYPNGEITDSSDWAHSEFVYTRGCQRIEVYNGFGIDINKSIEIYDKNKNKLSSYNFDANPKIIDLSGINDFYIRFDLYLNNGPNICGIYGIKDNIRNMIWKKVYRKKSIIPDDTFFGDLCEFNAYRSEEIVLNDVYHRFNTAQREIIDRLQSEEKEDGRCKFYSNEKYDDFRYIEIDSDDYDKNGFKTTELNINERGNLENFNTIFKYNLQTTIRPEGYLYKPHYKIQVREFGKIKQMSHSIISVRKAEPVQTNGIYIMITTTVNHNCSIGDTIYVAFRDRWYKTNVTYVESKTKFIINRISDKIFGFSDWISLCEKITQKSALLYKHNPNIPEYASNIGKNNFVWRDVLHTGDDDSVKTKDYVFTNGCFYINNDINFFLRRQDSENLFGLQSRYVFPNDIGGEIKKESNYIYKEEKDILC